MRSLSRRLLTIVSTAVLVTAAVATPAPDLGASGYWALDEPLHSLGGAGTLTDLSGATMTPDGTLWSVDNRLNQIASWVGTGGTWTLASAWDISELGLVTVTDPEGISWVGGDQFVVIDEATNRLLYITLSGAAPQLDRVVDLASWAPESTPGDGLEAVAHSHDESSATDDVVYVGDEVTATLLRVTIPVGTSVPSAVTSTLLDVPEIAGLADDPTSDSLFVMSQSDGWVYQTTTSGTPPVALFETDMFQPEGVFYDPANERLHVIGEGAQEHATWYRLTAALCNGLEVTIDMNLNGGSGIGSPDDDVILGTPGDDVIFGRGGHDTICGGAGVDRIRGEAGDDDIFGGPDRDVILGQDGDDHIYGEAGRDSLFGGPGDDMVDGGADTDLIRGEAGDDDLFSGPTGNDRMVGGPGADVLDARATSGSTRLLGEGDDDTFYGSDQLDRMWGGSGNDTMYARGYNDLLRGGDGDDWIYGEDRKDTLDGGPGSDRLFGGAGNGDKMVGGAGSDDRCDGGTGIGDTANATCEIVSGVP